MYYHLKDRNQTVKMKSGVRVPNLSLTKKGSHVSPFSQLHLPLVHLHRISAFLYPARIPSRHTRDTYSVRKRASCCLQTPKTPRTVGVAGAGIGGLATALCLLQTPGTGVEHVSIFEPRETLDTGLGGLLNINGGAAVLAKYYDTDIWKIGNETKTVVARDTNESLIFQVDVQKQLDKMPAEKDLLSKNGRPAFMSVMRDTLQELLYESVRSNAVSIHRGSEYKVLGVDTDGESPFFVLPNGRRSANFDLVVGADGIRSNVRPFVTGTEEAPEYSGIRVQWAINPPGSCSLNAHLLEQYFGNGGYALRYAAGLESSLTEAIAFSFRAKQGSAENILYRTESSVQQDMERRLEKCGMPQVIFDVFAKSTRFIETSVYYHKSLQSWSRGCCTLVGDSAHAMPPFLGQGANQAIQDAHTLARALADIGTLNSNLSQALQQYESMRRGPTTALMQSSRLIGLLETQGGPIGTKLRDTLFRVAGQTGAVAQTFVQSATPRIPRQGVK